MSLGTILIIILTLMLVGVLPADSGAMHRAGSSARWSSELSKRCVYAAAVLSGCCATREEKRG